MAVDVKVLIVDDTKLGRLSVKKILAKFDITNVTECDNGEGALELLSKQKFDIVLMDILMPGLSGLETLNAIKERNIQTSVYMVSADIQDTTKDKCSSAGAKGFINKPINEKKLKPIIEELGLL